MRELTAPELDLLRSARRAVLGTTADDGRPRLVPMAYAVGEADDLVIYSSLDEKPKSIDDPRRLARARDIAARPAVSFLVDRWSEDWSKLGWLRLDGQAALIEPDGGAGDEHQHALELLRVRYPQYAEQRLEGRPVVRIAVERARSWGLDA